VKTAITTLDGCSPQALGWGAGIVAAGNDRIVRFWDGEGHFLNEYDYTSDASVREFTCASFNPSGESVVLGNFNCFFVFAWHPRDREWREACRKNVDNLYSVSALAWKADGSRLVLGSLCGGIDMFDACIRRARYRGTYEFTYVSLSQVIVKNLNDGARIVLKSTVGFEIQKINIFQERFLVAHTPDSILLGDLVSCKLSEIPWMSSGDEKFYFDNPSVCMIFKAGELSLVEYGSNELLHCARTEHMSPHMISVRITDPVAGAAGPDRHVKCMAYLLDLQTVRISDMLNNTNVGTISHDSRVDWLELNPGAEKLLFRDKRRQLHLYDIASQSRTTLLNYCNYVQWVPGSDVVVAQSRQKLCVWYSIEAPDRVTVHEVKGDIEEIERSNGRTFVVVDEGINTVEYELDEALINFGSCLDRRQFAHAVDILEELPLTPETEAMWRQLADVATEEFCLPVAERCYAVLGDVSKARYLHKMNRIVQDNEQAGGFQHHQVQAKMAILQKQFGRAEAIYLEKNEIEEAMSMYQELHKYVESIRLAEKKNHGNVLQLKNQYLQWLLSTQQEDKAAELQEQEGNPKKAIELYLKAGMPAKAAQVVLQHNVPCSPRICAACQAAGMHDKAGELYERMGLVQQAMDSYRRGHAYTKAVELAKQKTPALVVQLEEEWGDWLVSQKQVDAAINHYIEARHAQKAIEAAMNARQWYKAEQLLDNAKDPDFTAPYYEKLAAHYAQARQFDQAQRAYLRTHKPDLAVQMYIEHNQFEKAHKVAKDNMSEAERSDLYINLAKKLEDEGKLNVAEQMYIMVKECDLAINMYKKREEYEQMLRLVSKYRKDLLTDTYEHIAQVYEMKGNLKQAEHYYVEANMWTSAMMMYKQLEKWDDAKRVAKQHGGNAAFEKVVLAQANETLKTQGSDAGIQLLAKHGLVEIAVDYALEHGNFQQAFDLANSAAKQKLPDVHLKKAMALEDDERLKEAEEEFIKAGKAEEAIHMYTHQRDWASAMRVAEIYDRDAVPEVMCAQAQELAESQGNYAHAEKLYLQASKPEKAVQMYRQKNMRQDAIRVCRKHCPRLLSELMDEPGGGGGLGGEGHTSLEDLLSTAKVFEETGSFGRAIDAYLAVNENMTTDHDQLEEVWENAVRLAMKHATERYQDVVSVVAKRLMNIQRFEQAAELYEGIEAYREAVNCYLAAESWEKARVLAQQQVPDLLGHVEEQIKNDLVARGKGDELVMKGDVASALKMYASGGEWQKCLALAEKSAPRLLPHYLIQNAKVLVNDHSYVEACQLLVRYNPPQSVECFPLYRAIASEMLSSKGLDPVSSTQILRELFMRLFKSTSMYVTPKQIVEEGDETTKEFGNLALTSHLFTIRGTCKERNEEKLAAKCSVALCRYCTELPVDRVFYEGGKGCKDVGWLNMAFFFFNRYLDFVDAIDDPDNVNIDNADFMNTDIPSPYDVDIPESHFYGNEVVEDIRDLVLGWSVDQSVKHEMDERECDSCGGKTYCAGLTCHKCKFKAEPCSVTGWPVRRATRVECSNCSSGANRDDWNQYLHLFKTCPWCGVPQNPSY